MTVTNPTDVIDFPSKGFIDQYEYYKTRSPSVTLVVEREVVDPLLIRNTESDRAETQRFNGVRRAQSNPEKFTTKERLTGIDLLRELDNDGELISSEYIYNEPPDIKNAINMDSLTYGQTSTEGQTYSIESRLTAGYTYTLGEYDIANAETRNAVYESGTMRDDENGQSQSLYEQVRIQPGNKFIHFITLEAATPAMLLYVMHNVLNTHTYGARNTRSGKTIQNRLRALILANNSSFLSHGEFITKHDPGTNTEDIGRELSNYIESKQQANWDVYGDGTIPNTRDFPDWFTTATAVANRKREDSKDILRDALTTDTETAQDTENGLPS